MSVSAPSVSGRGVNSHNTKTFFPRAVDSFEDAGLNPAIVESLVLKFLLNTGMAAGRRIAAELGLPFRPFPDFLRGLKNQQILAYANSASANDYVYLLTDSGRCGPGLTSKSVLMSARHRLPSTTTWKPWLPRRSPTSTPRNQT